jgi:hypothetical protein
MSDRSLAERYRTSTVTRILHMLTPSPSEREVERMSRGFAACTCRAERVVERASHAALRRQLACAGSLREPITEARVPLVALVACVAVGVLLCLAWHARLRAPAPAPKAAGRTPAWKETAWVPRSPLPPPS